MSRFRYCLLLVVLSFVPVALAQQALTNDAVLKMAKAGLGDDLIIQSINSQPGNYQTSAADLITLKSAGLSDRVIGAMIGKGIPAANGAHEPASSASAMAGVDEVGVYYKDRDNKWVQLAPEIINFKSGGVLKSIATDGIVKGDKNGHLNGKTGKIQLTRGTAILLYVPEGTSPEEYQLIRFRVNGNNREFRSETGGVVHSSTGAQRDSVPFTPTKVASRMYQFTITPDLTVGEYGILPPGSVATANAASGGKMYTFTLLE